MASGLSAGTLGVVGKWFTALLTTSAALVALLVNAQNLGLTSWVGATELGFSGYAVRRILVTPRADSLLSLGDTAVLAATVTDRRGAVLVGVPLVWTSEDTAVATVDSAGAVIARGPGLTRITAEVREHHASATILVRQQVARVVISGDSTHALPEMDSVRLSAVPFDARGNRVRGAAVSWSSTDTFAVTVDTAGRVRSRAPGRALIIASAGGRQGNVSVDVHLTPFRLRLAGGDAQHAMAGRALADPVTIEVLSRGGQPVPGAEVILSSSHGLVDRERVRSDVRGRIEANWTLGTRPGPQKLRARIAGIDSVVVAAAEADPVAALTRVELADSTPVGIAGSPLNPPVILRLTDTLGAPLAGVPVTWAAVDGGSVIALASRTDSLGQVIGRWTLGRKAGRQRLRVQVGDARAMPATVISATATAGAPATIAVLSGADQRVTAGKAAQPIVLLLRDSLGNPVTGVKLTARGSSGVMADSAPVSDRSGRATLRWSAGTAPGPASVTVAAGDSGVRQSVAIRVVAAPVKPAPAMRPVIAKRPAAKPEAKKPRR